MGTRRQVGELKLAVVLVVGGEIAHRRLATENRGGLVHDFAEHPAEIKTIGKS